MVLTLSFFFNFRSATQASYLNEIYTEVVKTAPIFYGEMEKVPGFAIFEGHVSSTV